MERQTRMAEYLATAKQQLDNPASQAHSGTSSPGGGGGTGASVNSAPATGKNAKKTAKRNAKVLKKNAAIPRTSIPRSCKNGTQTSVAPASASVTSHGEASSPPSSPAVTSSDDKANPSSSPCTEASVIGEPHGHGAASSSTSADEAEFITSSYSLSQMLAPDTPMPSTSQGQWDALHSQLSTASEDITKLCGENNSLMRQIKLLEDELDKYKKLNTNQKNAIKKLTCDNDKLKKQISQYTGIRKYTSISNVGDSQNGDSANSEIIEQLHITQAKLKSFHDQVTIAANTLVSALGGDSDIINDNGFEIVKRSKRSSIRRTTNDTVNQSTSPQQISPERHQPSDERSHTVPSRSVTGQSCTPPPPTPSNAQVTQCIGQPITVVSIGAAAARAAYTANARASANTDALMPPQSVTNIATDRRPPARDETVIIGTSLTRGVGEQLRKRGVDSTCFSYAGTQIPHIRSRVAHILNTHQQPANVILQCGGNDLETQPAEKVIAHYESLVGIVRARCPKSNIILSRVPYRRRGRNLNSKINCLNSYLESRGNRNDGISYVDACPPSLDMFKKDLVHFNVKGLKFYADKLSNFVSFPPLNSRWS